MQPDQYGLLVNPVLADLPSCTADVEIEFDVTDRHPHGPLLRPDLAKPATDYSRGRPLRCASVHECTLNPPARLRRTQSVGFELAMTSRTLIGSLLVLAALSISTSAGANDATPGLTQMFRSGPEGIATRYPSSWVLTNAVSTIVTNPVVCFALDPARNSSVDVTIVEYLPPLRPRDLRQYQPRPAHFKLRSFHKSDVDWTTGKIMSFRNQGRVFYIGVVTPKASSTSLMQMIQAILDSLQIKPSGRC